MAVSLDLSERVAVVTGGAGSIGSAIVERLIDAGAAVGTIDREFDAPAGSSQGLAASPGQALAVAADLTDRESIDSAIDEIARKLGPPSILVNAAGVLRVGALDEASDEMWLQSMDVNVMGAMRATRSMLPYLRGAEAPAIVNIGSVAADIGSPDGSPYSASKGAIISMTYAHAGELAREGIRVNCVSPGWVEGGFTEIGRRSAADPDSFMSSARALHYLDRLGRPSEIADAVLWLASPLSSFVTGANVVVDGGFSIKHG
jgi:NAD(P)-dependent dehydrogenase (short-subunit alcohol dehydrogenase family)